MTHYNLTEIEESIQSLCNSPTGLLNPRFLCQSVSLLSTHPPICIHEEESLLKAVTLMQDNRVGCLLITKPDGVLTGILSERDLVRKVMNKNIDLETTPVNAVMTKDPITQPPDTTVAFVLNLMSRGGFRHMPIVDESLIPIAILSVKDVIDAMVESMFAEVASITEQL